jgi:hypothetical protein
MLICFTLTLSFLTQTTLDDACDSAATNAKANRRNSTGSFMMNNQFKLLL